MSEEERRREREGSGRPREREGSGRPREREGSGRPRVSPFSPFPFGSPLQQVMMGTWRIRSWSSSDPPVWPDRFMNFGF